MKFLKNIIQWINHSYSNSKYWEKRNEEIIDQINASIIKIIHSDSEIDLENWNSLIIQSMFNTYSYWEWKIFNSYENRNKRGNWYFDTFLRQVLPTTFWLEIWDQSIDIVDIACGDWGFLRMLTNEWWNNVLWLDKFTNQIDLCIKWDVENMPFLDWSKHLVTSTMLFDKSSFQWIQQLLAYDEIFRVLKPWGFYLWCEPRGMQSFATCLHDGWDIISIESYALMKNIPIVARWDEFIVLQKPLEYPYHQSLLKRVSYNLYKIFQTNVLDK